MGFRSVTPNAGSGVNSLLVTRPSGAVAGDILLAFVRQNEDTNTVTPPSGWTPLQGGVVGTGRFSAYGADGAVAALTFNFSGAADVVAHVLCYTGVIQIDSSALGSADTSSGVAITAPSLTPQAGITDNILVCGFSARQGTGPAVAPPGTMNERWENSFPAILDTADEIITGSSATGTRVAAMSSANLNRMAISVMIRANPTAPPVTDHPVLYPFISRYMGRF